MAEANPPDLALPEQLVGDRVSLRPWRESDAPALFDLVTRSREHIGRWMSWSYTYRSVDDARAFVRLAASEWSPTRDLDLGIFDREGGLLGGVRLHPARCEGPAFSIGYWLGATYEGQGYVTDAVRLVIPFAVNALGATRLFITCDARNRRSANVARRCGFTLVGVPQSNGKRPDGRFPEMMLFSLLPGDRA